MRLDRSRNEANPRLLALRVGLLFLAGGVWLGGVGAGSRWWTGTAIVLLALALVAGRLAGRGGEPRDDAGAQP